MTASVSLFSLLLASDGSFGTSVSVGVDMIHVASLSLFRLAVQSMDTVKKYTTVRSIHLVILDCPCIVREETARKDGVLMSTFLGICFAPLPPRKRVLHPVKRSSKLSFFPVAGVQAFRQDSPQAGLSQVRLQIHLFPTKGKAKT